MNYEADDVFRLVRPIPYLQLMRSSTALALLRKQAAAIDTWGEFIPQYRTVRCQPLDFIYVYLRCLGALDALLLQDLLAEFTWREMVCGAWLAALSSNWEFRAQLLAVRSTAGTRQWIVDLSVAALDLVQPPDLAEHLHLLAKIRGALELVPRPVTILARPDLGQSEEMAHDTDEVREIYRANGHDAALAYLRARPWRSKLPSFRNRLRDASEQSCRPDAWSWGLHAPFSTVDLFNWRPPTQVELVARPQSRAILVVHGEDIGSRDRVYRFLEQMDFQPVSLRELSTLETAGADGVGTSGEARYAIVLLTPEGAPMNGRRITSDAVLRDLNYLVHRFPRPRVCVLKHGDVEAPPSMSVGRCIDFDDHGVWRSELTEELVAADYDVNWSKLIT